MSNTTPDRPLRTHTRLCALCLPALLAGALLAGCGSGGSSTASTATVAVKSAALSASAHTTVPSAHPGAAHGATLPTGHAAKAGEHLTAHGSSPSTPSSPLTRSRLRRSSSATRPSAAKVAPKVPKAVFPTRNKSGHLNATKPKNGSVTYAEPSRELPPPIEGQLALASPAFERNGAIPAEYTCDGKNISPPLEWENVPSGAAALVLIAIDTSATGSASGIRWFVADINPKSTGVAAGQVPEGGIVGADTQGHTGYGGVCPDHGKESQVEFLLYALKKTIPVTTGFSPQSAEIDYGGTNKLIMTESATTYGIYVRP
jgi:hypothetical protein